MGFSPLHLPPSYLQAFVWPSLPLSHVHARCTQHLLGLPLPVYVPLLPACPQNPKTWRGPWQLLLDSPSHLAMPWGQMLLDREDQSLPPSPSTVLSSHRLTGSLPWPRVAHPYPYPATGGMTVAGTYTGHLTQWEVSTVWEWGCQATGRLR